MRVVSAVLGFKTLPTTVLLLLIYLAVFVSVLITDRLPNVPKDQGGLDLEQAYLDLHHIAARPHPYNSHANDHVRSYLLSRLHQIASHYADDPDSTSRIRIWDDLSTNVSLVRTTPVGVGLGTYFEGTNILVKVDGTDPAYVHEGGVLFSAHYDSVSTAPGVTDDGMSIVSMLQMVELLARKRGKRTAVFNFNNGEEDGLHGAHAFLGHPWGERVDTFLNLEGAGAGGRPVLFRASSTAPLRAFHVSHPHTNVLAADAFALGVIRSGTDYSVYTGPGIGGGLDGLDLAFYEGRAFYHTKWDSVPGLKGGRKALWAMMETVRDAGLVLVNDGRTHERKSGDAVYFDLFGSSLVLFPLTVLIVLNYVFLVFGPLIVVILIFTKHVVDLHGQPIEESMWTRAWNSFKGRRWGKVLWGRAKFWLALFCAIVMETLLVVGYVKINPFAVYSHKYLVLTTTLSLAFLTLVIPLKFPIVLHAPLLPEVEKLTVLLQTYILTWFLLLLSTIALMRFKTGGVYFITTWHVLVFLALVLGYVEVLKGAKGSRDEYAQTARRLVRGVRIEVDEGASARVRRVDAEAPPTEVTPLLAQTPHEQTGEGRSRRREVEGAVGWWIVQMLLVVPFPVILMCHLGVLLLHALAQTLADGSSPAVVYGATAALSVFIVLPLAPFSVKINRVLTLSICALFILTTTYAWTAVPFSRDAPLKVFFQQKLTLSDDGADVLSARTYLTGTPLYLRKVVKALPSSWQKDVSCDDRGLGGLFPKLGLWSCGWDSGVLLPSPGGVGGKKWIRLAATRVNETNGRITIRGTNTRNCRLYFDKPIRGFSMVGVGNSTLQPGYDEVGPGGIRVLKLFSRQWNHPFVVDVTIEDGARINGTAACEWTEYESGVAGGMGGTGEKIPALEEALTFLPKWAVLSKADDGLVEVEWRFGL